MLFLVGRGRGGGWGHRRHGRGVGNLGALQEACSGNPPRDVNALSKREPNPALQREPPARHKRALQREPNPNPPLRRLLKRCASRLRFEEATGPYRSLELRRMIDEYTAAECDHNSQSEWCFDETNSFRTRYILFPRSRPSSHTYHVPPRPPRRAHCR